MGYRKARRKVAAEQRRRVFVFVGAGNTRGAIRNLVTTLDAAQAARPDRVRFTVRAVGPAPVRRCAFPAVRPVSGAPFGLRRPDASHGRGEPAGFSRDGTTSQRPVVAHGRSVLFVVDTINTSPSTRGRCGFQTRPSEGEHGQVGAGPAPVRTGASPGGADPRGRPASVRTVSTRYRPPP
jgi:hypothetical protein